MFHELAFQIAKKAHSKQVDKAGKDYILHPMKVASYMIRIQKRQLRIYMMY